MEVIGVGFGRTGTASLKLALERVGFGPCYHMFEVLERPERARDWMEAADGGPADWDRILAGYRSTVDWPGTYFWRELVDAYPGARVVLTVRDPAAWYDSAAGTIFRATLRSSRPLARLLLRLGRPRALREFTPMVRRLIWDGTFDGRFADRDHAIRVFERHGEEVRRRVPADRLLVLDVGQGWEPLCAFLGVPVPDEPFPRVNDAKTFRRRQRVAALRTLAAPALLGTAAVAAAAALALRSGRGRARR